MREKCSNTEFSSGPCFPAFWLNTYLLRKSPSSIWIQENKDQKNSVFRHISCMTRLKTFHFSSQAIRDAYHNLFYSWRYLFLSRCIKNHRLQWAQEGLNCEVLPSMSFIFCTSCKILCGSWLYVSLETILKKVEILRSEILNDYLRLSENDYRTKSKFLFKSFFSKCQSVSYIFKVNIRNTRARCEICPKLTYFTPCSRVSIVNFGQINVEWVWTNLH